MIGILEAQGHHCPGGDIPMKPPSHFLGNALLPASGGPLVDVLSVTVVSSPVWTPLVLLIFFFCFAI